MLIKFRLNVVVLSWCFFTFSHFHHCIYYLEVPVLCSFLCSLAEHHYSLSFLHHSLFMFESWCMPRVLCQMITPPQSIIHATMKLCLVLLYTENHSNFCRANCKVTWCCISGYWMMEARTRLSMWTAVIVVAIGMNTSFLDGLYNNQATMETYMYYCKIKVTLFNNYNPGCRVLIKHFTSLVSLY